eukprot:CFRG2672T1
MSVLAKDTIRLVAESIGVGNISEDVCAQLAPDVEYRLQEIIQEAIKFQRHSRRTTFSTTDVNNALRVKNVEPLYGYKPIEPITIKNVGQADKSLFYIVDEEVDLTEVINAPLPPCPADVTYCAHWLAIEGIQPAIPENPQIIVTSEKNFTKKPAETKSEKDAKSSDTSKRPTGSASMAQTLGIDTDTKPAVSHVLSKEQQMYFEKMTEAIVGSEERLRTAALESLSNDPGLQQLIPYFCQFITEKVANNNRNLPLLMAMMRMAKALVYNTNLFMDPYLHLIISAVLTCVLKKTLSQHAMENHWALRDLSAELIAHICSRWGDSVITLQTRITKMYLRGLLEINKSLPTNYGAVVGMTALGRNVVHSLLLPNLKAYSAILEPALSAKNTNPNRREEALRVQGALLDAVGKFFRNYSDHALNSDMSTDHGGDRALPPKVSVSESYLDMLGIFGEALQPYINNYNIEVLHTLTAQTEHRRRLLKRRKKEKKTKESHEATHDDIATVPVGPNLQSHTTTPDATVHHMHE